MSDGRGTPFSGADRRALLDEFFAVGARLDAVPASMEPNPADLARYAELRRTYREQIPVLPLSRCPFTKIVYEHSIDPFGLDGLWWDYRSPNRPLEMLRGNVLAFTGAVQVGKPLEQMPFLCRPGPEAPFVVPRILSRSGVRAVLYSLPIGVHIGYVITYFADPAPDNLEGFNDWGTDFYQFESDTDRLGWNQASATAADHDFSLEPYLTSRQLLWISPGDESMTLREGVQGCPYLDLEGSRVPQLVQDGERWLAEFPIDDDQLPAAGPEPDESSDGEGSATNVSGDDVELAPVPAVGVSRPAATAPAAPVAPAQAPARGCFRCGAALKPTSKFCPSCGAPVSTPPVPPTPPPPPPASDTCVHCGQPRRPGAKFCRSCGKA